MSDAETAWPPSLREYVATGDRAKIRLRPYEPVENTTMMVVITGAIVALTCAGPFIGSGLIPCLFGAAVSLFLIIMLASDRLRWCEVERIETGWRVTHGISNWRKRECLFKESEVLTVVLMSHVGFVNYGGRAHYYLRVEFSNHGFGEKPSLSVGRRLVLPKQTLADLAALFQGKASPAKNLEEVSEGLA